MNEDRIQRRDAEGAEGAQRDDRPDLELEALVMGDEADGVRPSEGWLVREDVVRGAVELITGLLERVEELNGLLVKGLEAAANCTDDFHGMVEKRSQAEKDALQARADLARSEMEAAELREEKDIADQACNKAVEMMSEAMTKASKAQAEVKLLREQVEALTAQLEEEEAQVKRLREVVLGAPRGTVEVYEPPRYVGDRWIVALLPESWTNGTKIALVRLSPDGTELAATTDDTNHTEGADA